MNRILWFPCRLCHSHFGGLPEATGWPHPAALSPYLYYCSGMSSRRGWADNSALLACFWRPISPHPRNQSWEVPVPSTALFRLLAECGAGAIVAGLLHRHPYAKIHDVESACQLAVFQGGWQTSRDLLVAYRVRAGPALTFAGEHEWRPYDEPVTWGYRFFDCRNTRTPQKTS